MDVWAQIAEFWLSGSWGGRGESCSWGGVVHTQLGGLWGCQRVSQVDPTPGIPTAAKRSERWSPATTPLHGLSFETLTVHQPLLF